jgi:hypothetical protein
METRAPQKPGREGGMKGQMARDDAPQGFHKR